MTIAIGMFAKEALIIAADSQETLGGYKLDTSKIMVANKGDSRPQGAGTLVATGAGWSGYLDAVNQAICFGFLRNTWSDADLMQMLDDRVKDFHRDHILRMNNLLSDDRPDMSLLIGEYLPAESPRLFHSVESVISEVTGYCSVGSGQPYADAMLERYWRSNMQMKQGIALAAYVVSNVKKTVHGCGNLTHIVCLSSAHTERVKQKDIEDLEDALDEHISNGNQMLHFITGHPFSEKETKQRAKTFSDELLASRKRILGIQEAMELENIESGVRQLDRPPFRLVNS
jgi:hypothetical protein